MPIRDARPPAGAAATRAARAAALCLAVATRLQSQQPNLAAPQTLGDIQPTVAPAFILLGVEPSSVQRPTTPKALKTTVLTLASDEGGVPRNFALEITPFWLTPKPAFAVDSFFSPSLSTRVLRTASFAVATTPSLVGTDTTGTSIAGSFRTTILSPGKPAGFDALVSGLQRHLGRCAAEQDEEEEEECFAAARDSLNRLRELLKYPPGLSVELAAGLSGDAPGDVAESLRWRRVGVWLTPSYTLSGAIDAIAVVRYLRERGDQGGDSSRGLLDYGGRLLWRTTSSLAFSGEVVGRRYSGDDVADASTVRYGGLIEYRAAERLYVFYAFGKDFAAADAPRSRLLSSIGLNIGFGPEPRVRLDASGSR